MREIDVLGVGHASGQRVCSADHGHGTCRSMWRDGSAGATHAQQCSSCTGPPAPPLLRTQLEIIVDVTLQRPRLSTTEFGGMVPPPVLLTEWATWACDLIERGNRLLASPTVTALQFHGIWLAALLATLWVQAGRARLRELERQRRRAPGRHGASPRPASGAALAAAAAAAAAEHEVGCCAA